MKLAHNPFDGRVGFKRTTGSAPAGGDRREIFSLAGAVAIFFVGMPGHSTTVLSSTQHLVKHLIQLVLVFLGLAAPVHPPSPESIALAPRVPTAAALRKKPLVRPSIPNSMALRTVSNLRHYTYRFEGKASHQGEICPNASVLVRIISGEKTFTKGGITNEDGTYSIEVPVLAEDGAPVDWRVEAFSSEFQKLEMSGRRIVQQEEEQSQEPIVVTTPVEFSVTLSK